MMHSMSIMYLFKVMWKFSLELATSLQKIIKMENFTVGLRDNLSVFLVNALK